MWRFPLLQSGNRFVLLLSPPGARGWPTPLGSWYRYVTAINKTVPRSACGIGLKVDTASAASHDAVYMNPAALARRFAAIESSGIDQIGMYGGFTFNVLDEYRPLLRAFLAGRSASRDWE